jgi:hypothetical protein
MFARAVCRQAIDAAEGAAASNKFSERLIKMKNEGEFPRLSSFILNLFRFPVLDKDQRD